MSKEKTMQDITPETPKKCACGGHGHSRAKAKEQHSGCGCHASPAPQPPPPELAPEAHSCGGDCRGIRTTRRLHAALGVLLMGFLLLHLGVASLGWAPARYDAVAARLRHLSEQLPFLEIGLLLAITVQILVGIQLLIRSGLGIKASRCKEDDRLRYFLQRWSGLFLLLFLTVHLALFKLWPSAPSFAAASVRFTLGGNGFWIGFTLPITGLAFHAGSGLWTGASVWGVRDRHPRFWLGLAGAAGGLIALLGFGAFFAFVR